jgi:hypothetical protein
MAGIPQHAHSAVPATPSAWHDLKRDWQRWSHAERIAAECALAFMLVSAAAALSSLAF